MSFRRNGLHRFVSGPVCWCFWDRGHRHTHREAQVCLSLLFPSHASKGPKHFTNMLIIEIGLPCRAQALGITMLGDLQKANCPFEKQRVVGICNDEKGAEKEVSSSRRYRE